MTTFEMFYLSVDEILLLLLGLIALFLPIFCQLCDFAPHVFKRAILHPILFPLSDLKAPHVF